MSKRGFDVIHQLDDTESIELVLFGFLDFVGDPMFLGTHAGVITWGGEDWLGLGEWANLEPLSESIELNASKFRMTLSAPTQELLGEALYENTAGRRVELYLGTWENDQLNGDPQLIVVGHMGPPEIVLGTSSAASITVEDVRASLDTINGRRSTEADHTRDWPGDRFFRFLPQMMDHRYIFNGTEVGEDLSNGRPIGGGNGSRERYRDRR